MPCVSNIPIPPFSCYYALPDIRHTYQSSIYPWFMWSHDLGHGPFDIINNCDCAFYGGTSCGQSVYKFVGCSFSRSRDIKGAANFESRSHDLGHPLLILNLTICVKFTLFDSMVKFYDDSFIGRQEICWTAVHWL